MNGVGGGVCTRKNDASSSSVVVTSRESRPAAINAGSDAAESTTITIEVTWGPSRTASSTPRAVRG